MRISDVLRALRAEFPEVTQSKLRFLEEQGLIEPVRTAAGYRQYSAADLERLRFVLLEQRDKYLPLRVIKEKLADLDAVGESPSTTLTPVADEPEGERPYTLSRLTAEAGLEPALVDELVTAGLLHPGEGGVLDEDAYTIAITAAALAPYGIHARHLRSLRTASDRHVALIEQVIAPWRSQSSTAAQEHAAQVGTHVADLCSQLHILWVRQGVRDLLD